jgi:S1-C subfamily serine protease
VVPLDPTTETGSTRAALDSLASRPGTRPTPVPLPTTRRGMLRYRVLPRTVLGISMLILAFAIGAGFSGVVLYSYYQYKQNQTDTRVNTLINGYKSQFAKAESDLNAAVAAARANIDNQVKAAQQLQAGPAQLATLIKQMAPSVFFVHTQDANGQPSVGSAFIVSSSSSQTLLITSYTTVAAATHSPGPNVYIRQGNTDTQVTVKAWDPQYDLALLTLPKGGLAALTAAPTSPAPQPGDRLFAVSGLGSAGASLAQGSVVDVSGSGVALDDAISPAFQGGPIVNQAGQVVAVASRTYAPLGFTSDGVWYSPYVESACSKVLSCPGGTLVGSH